MIKFNILLLLAGLKQSLEANTLLPVVDFDLTLKPEKGDLFTHVPASERSSYLRYVSMVYKVKLDRGDGLAFPFYIFIRNGKETDGSYTRLSSIELGYIKNKQFYSFFKEHFTDMVPSGTLYFNSFEDMKNAARSIREVLLKSIWTQVQIELSVPF